MNNYAIPEGLYANEEFVQENKCVLLSELFRCAFGIYSKYFDRLLIKNNVNLGEAALRSSLSRVIIVCCQYITSLNLKIEEPSFTEIVEM